MTGGRRAASILGLLALLVVALAVDHVEFPARATAQATGPTPVMPSLAAKGTLASTWFCPALGATADSPVKGRIIVANPGPGPLQVVATFVPSAGNPVSQTSTVAPYTRTTYKLEGIAPAPFTATIIDIDGAGGAVEQEIQGPIGQSISPCSTTSSNTWYFASGRTDTGSSMLLSLFNPFSVNAIVNLSFATDQGPSIPDADQGLVIPPMSDLVVNVGDRVRLRTAIATTVATVAGRVIADKIQLQSATGAQGSTPFKGLALTVGDTAPGRLWYFADGVKAPGITEHFDVYAPGNAEADVQVAPALESGAAQPFGLTVAPGDRVTLQVDQESRIPASVGQAWVVSSTNGVPVVVERVYEELPPAAREGVADSMGAPRLAKEWVFPGGSAAAGGDEYIIAFNPGTVPARVVMTASGFGQPVPLSNANPLVLGPGQRRAIRVGDAFKQGIVIVDVTSDQPIVAERAQANVDQPGLSGTIGVAGS